MNKATLLAAAAAIAFIATPVLAQSTAKPHANVHMKSSKMRQHGMHQSRAMHSGDRLARRDERGNWSHTDWHHRSGFWPTDTAGAIAGGAIATAGAIATGPFRSGYYDNGYYGEYRRPYGDVTYPNGYRHDNAYASMEEGFGTYNYNGTAIPGSPSFDARNGFTCRPGTITKLNGRPAICQ